MDLDVADEAAARERVHGHQQLAQLPDHQSSAALAARPPGCRAAAATTAADLAVHDAAPGLGHDQAALYRPRRGWTTWWQPPRGRPRWPRVGDWHRLGVPDAVGFLAAAAGAGAGPGVRVGAQRAQPGLGGLQLRVHLGATRGVTLNGMVETPQGTQADPAAAHTRARTWATWAWRAWSRDSSAMAGSPGRFYCHGE